MNDIPERSIDRNDWVNVLLYGKALLVKSQYQLRKHQLVTPRGEFQ